ncbi:MAG TPA: methylenetetrahydrofolate reductase [Methylomirabilota bacterium]
MSEAVPPRYDDEFRRRLSRRAFTVIVECVTPPASAPLEGSLAPLVELAERLKGSDEVHALTLTDRVRCDVDHDPVAVAPRVAAGSGRMPLVHLAGKGRDRRSLEPVLARLATSGLESVLLTTGDPPAPASAPPLDAVEMIRLARALHPALHIAAVVSPFHLGDDQRRGEYARAADKERAGADVFIAQLGWDMGKVAELASWRRDHGLRAPLLLSVALVTAARARWFASARLPGVVLTRELETAVAREQRAADGGRAAAYRRLALQIVGAEWLGYAGVLLVGIQDARKIGRVVADVDRLRGELGTEDAWWSAWQTALGGRDGAGRGRERAHGQE